MFLESVYLQMKEFTLYHPIFKKSIIVLVLLGLMWSNTATYYSWMLDPDQCLLEFFVPMDGETEGEEKESEEKINERFRLYFPYLDFSESRAKLNKLHKQIFQSKFHPEIPTPPPQMS